MNSTNEITAEITALTEGGSGIGPIVKGPTELINKKTFVPFTIPGEVVQAIITEDKKSYCTAELVSIHKSSEKRITPACEYFQNCGGCQLQHIELNEQRRLKLDLLQSTLKMKKITCAEEISCIGQELSGFAYRRRVNLHVNLAGAIGFFQKNSTTVVPIKKCLLVNDIINTSIAKLNKLPAVLAGQIAGITIESVGKTSHCIFKVTDNFNSKNITALSDKITSTCDQFIIKSNNKVLFNNITSLNNLNQHEQLSGHFSQVNPAANNLLVDLVGSLIKGSRIDDLYAGYGNLSLPLAAKNKTIRAIEIDAALVEYGRLLAKQNPTYQTIEFFNQSAEQFTKKNKLAETVLLDPPRSGAKFVTEKINRLDTKHIVYVSCSLPTFIRDSQMLIARGWQLKKLYLLDMFAQTYHMELVGVFDG